MDEDKLGKTMIFILILQAIVLLFALAGFFGVWHYTSIMVILVFAFFIISIGAIIISIYVIIKKYVSTKLIAKIVLIISILSLLILTQFIVGILSFSLFDPLPNYKSCAARYGGTCVPADQCPVGMMTPVATECDAKGMVCCPVNPR